MSREHRPKKVRIDLSPNPFGIKKNVRLSDLTFGEPDYGLRKRNSFVEINEEREVIYFKYCELLKKTRLKVEIRKEESEDKPKSKVKIR